MAQTFASRLRCFKAVATRIRKLTRAVVLFGLVVVTTAYAPTLARAQSSDDSLRIYAVSIVKYTPYRFNGDGIYLGHGLVITAAHVVGHWPSLTRPHVVVADQDLAAKIIKEGSFEAVDLALLSVDETVLPVSLRLRRNPLCKEAPTVGMEVIDVSPKETARARIISPMLIPPQFRAKYPTLITAPQRSGSGLFDAEQKCLLGIMSAKVLKYNVRKRALGVFTKPNGYAGYFVPAFTIASFIPPNFRF